MNEPIYMDYQATTPVDPRVLEAMLPYLQSKFGNAASKSHRFGWEADSAVKLAREQCASAIGADAQEIVFTSGSTEGINLALQGAMDANRERGRHLVTAATEHPAVLDTAAYLAGRGCDVTVLPVDRAGSIDLAELRAALRDDTVLVSLMAANNEIGTLHPVGEIGALCRKRGVLFFTDATQAVGKVPLDVDRDSIDMLSISAHKLYGPKGAGVLYVRRRRPRVLLTPQLHGGGHEGGFRSGTLNVPGIVGLGKACQIAVAEREEEGARLTSMRRRLESEVMGALDHVYLNGHPTERLPGNLNLAFRYVDGDALMMDLNEVALSSGSACNSASMQPSHVLSATGLEDELAYSSLRFGLGRMTTEEEVSRVAEMVIGSVRRLREMSPMYELAKTARQEGDPEPPAPGP